MTARRRIGAVAAGVPLALLGVLLVEGWFAANAEYLPHDPGYVIEATLTPAGAPPTAGPPLRIVMLGDSTVAGVGSPTLQTSLPVLVGQRVADRLGRAVEVVGLGVSGARTRTVRDEQVPQLVDRSADAVVVVIGSNDVTHATPPWRFDDLSRTMLRAAREQSGGAAVILAGIPLFGSADAVAEPLRSVVGLYARVLRPLQREAAAAVEGAHFVDIARDASPRFVGVPEAMSSDGFHPAPVGYGFWADAIAPAVADALRSGATSG